MLGVDNDLAFIDGSSWEQLSCWARSGAIETKVMRYLTFYIDPENLHFTFHPKMSKMWEVDPETRAKVSKSDWLEFHFHFSESVVLYLICMNTNICRFVAVPNIENQWE